MGNIYQKIVDHIGKKKADNICKRKAKGRELWLQLSFWAAEVYFHIWGQLQKPPLKYYIERDGIIYTSIQLFRFVKDKVGTGHSWCRGIPTIDTGAL